MAYRYRSGYSRRADVFPHLLLDGRPAGARLDVFGDGVGGDGGVALDPHVDQVGVERRRRFFTFQAGLLRRQRREGGRRQHGRTQQSGADQSEHRQRAPAPPGWTAQLFGAAGVVPDT